MVIKISKMKETWKEAGRRHGWTSRTKVKPARAPEQLATCTPALHHTLLLRKRCNREGTSQPQRYTNAGQGRRHNSTWMVQARWRDAQAGPVHHSQLTATSHQVQAPLDQFFTLAPGNL